MIAISEMFNIMYSRLEPTMRELGFKPDVPEGVSRAETPVFKRGDKEGYIQFSGEKGKLRLLYNEGKIRLLLGDKDAKSEDDSDYTVLASFLMLPDEFEEKDVRSSCNEIDENIREEFLPKSVARRQKNVKAQATVTRSQVKSGALLYDSATLAVKLGAIWPELKTLYTDHLKEYDEFLPEDFFMTNVNKRTEELILSRDAVKTKKLFNILNEVYEDGSNEVQDVIVVTLLCSIDYPTDIYDEVIGFMSDTLKEPFIRVNSYLRSSKSARMRLQNPPKYKPKKKKKRSSIIDMLTGGSGGIGG